MNTVLFSSVQSSTPGGFDHCAVHVTEYEAFGSEAHSVVGMMRLSSSPLVRLVESRETFGDVYAPDSKTGHYPSHHVVINMPRPADRALDGKLTSKSPNAQKMEIGILIGRNWQMAPTNSDAIYY